MTSTFRTARCGPAQGREFKRVRKAMLDEAEQRALQQGRQQSLA